VLFVIKHFTKYTLCFHTHTPHHTKSALGSRGRDNGLFEKVSFQTSFESVKSG